MTDLVPVVLELLVDLRPAHDLHVLDLVTFSPAVRLASWNRLSRHADLTVVLEILDLLVDLAFAMGLLVAPWPVHVKVRLFFVLLRDLSSLPPVLVSGEDSGVVALRRVCILLGFLLPLLGLLVGLSVV